MDCCGARCEGTDGGLGGHRLIGDFGTGPGDWTLLAAGLVGLGLVTSRHGTWRTAAEEGRKGGQGRNTSTPMSLFLLTGSWTGH